MDLRGVLCEQSEELFCVLLGHQFTEQRDFDPVFGGYGSHAGDLDVRAVAVP
jgi:hypothetical protein